MANKILRPLNVTGILDETFDLYKKNFVLFVGIAALRQLPVSILTYSCSKSVQSFMGIFMGLFVTNIVMAATAQAVSQRYLDQTATILGSYRSVMRKIFPFIGTMILANMIIGFGFMLLVVPGIIFACWYAFIPAVFVLEGKVSVAARNRSKEIAKGEYGRIIVIGLISGIITIIVAAVPVVWDFLFTGTGLNALTKSGSGFLYGLGEGVVTTLLTPIQVIIFVLLYYDIRVRKEGFDIEMLAQSIGAPVSAPPALQPGATEPTQTVETFAPPVGEQPPAPEPPTAVEPEAPETEEQASPQDENG